MQIDASTDPEVVRLLGAELRTRHIGLCVTPGPGAEAPAATLILVVDDVHARVEVRDAVTEKIVARDVALTGVPRDTRALTIALASDELLRATWAELVLRSSLPRPKPPPPEVVAVVREHVREPPVIVRPVVETVAPTRLALGAAAATDVFVATTTTTLVGADVFLLVWLAPRVHVEARLGLRSGLSATGPDGSVQTSTLGGRLGLGVTVTPPDAWLGLDVAARIGLLHATFAPTPNANATAVARDDTAVTLDGSLDGWIRAGPRTRLLASIGPTFAVRPVRIEDGTTVIGGIDGTGLTASLGLAGTF